MKVICIDDKPESGGGCFLIREGETYNAEEGVLYPITSKPSYFIVECKQYYYKRRFIPLSEIDETDLVKQREEECIS